MPEPLFVDRDRAGWRLGARLSGSEDRVVVLGLARGGVPVAARVAEALHTELDVVVTAKISRPGHAEVGVGAVAEDGPAVWDEAGLQRYGLLADGLAGAVERAREEVDRRVGYYRRGRPLPEFGERDLVLVDDGIATGVTVRAALRWLRGRRPGPRRVVVATPVCSRYAAEGACAEADEVVSLATPDPFGAVSGWYGAFPQLTDDEVMTVLRHRSA